MMTAKRPKTEGACLWKGLLAGAVAGLVAAGVKAAAEVVYLPRTAGQTPPPVALFRKISGGPGVWYRPERAHARNDASHSGPVRSIAAANSA